MALPTTPKQCDVKIRSLKKQVTAMMERKKKLADAAKKKAPAKKAPAKKPAAKRKAPMKKKK